MKINTILKGIIILAFGVNLTGCSCSSFHSNCVIAMATVAVVTAPVTIPYANAKKRSQILKNLEEDQALIDAITTGNDRNDLEKAVLGRISYHTPHEQHIYAKRLASSKLIEYDGFDTTDWNEDQLAAMIIAYTNQAKVYLNNEKFNQYASRAWELYLQYMNSNYYSYKHSNNFFYITPQYYLVKHKLLNENSDIEKASPILKQCLKDPIWDINDLYKDGNNGYEKCKYILRVYNIKKNNNVDANQDILDEIESQYEENRNKKVSANAEKVN